MKGVGFLAPLAATPSAVMCLDKSFQTVQSHLPESVFAIPKYCVRKLLTLWNGHEGEIQLTETRYSTVVAWELYRLRFAKPTQPFPSIDPYFRQFDAVTSLATFKMSDFRQVVNKVSKVWEPSELAGVHVERNQGHLELRFKTRDKQEGAEIEIPAESFDGEMPDFYFDFDFVLKALQNIAGNEVELSGDLDNYGKLVFLKSADDDDFEWMLMLAQMKRDYVDLDETDQSLRYQLKTPKLP